MNPATTERARRSSPRSLARTSGLKYFVDAGIFQSVRRAGRHVFENVIDNLVGGIPFRVGGVVGDDAVPQDRLGQRADVILGDMLAALYHRASLAA